MPQQEKISAQDAADYLESDEFKKLSPDKKKKVVDYFKANLSRDVPSGVPSVPQRKTPKSIFSMSPDESSVPGGFVSRAGQAMEGVTSLANPKAQDEFEKGGSFVSKVAKRNPGTRLVRQYKQSADRLAQQAGEQEFRGEKARAFNTKLAMFNPLAAGSVADINQQMDEGQFKKAYGTALFDVLNLVASKPSKYSESRFPLSQAGREFKVGKLAYAAGEGAENFRRTLPDIEQTIKKTGNPPKTVGQLKGVIEETGKALESEFNTALQPIRSNKLVPIDISQDLYNKANRPNLAKTAEGRAERLALRRAALDFQRPWTIEELNLERMRRYNNRLESKSGVGQMQAVRSSVDTAIDQIVENGTRDIVYRELGKATGKDFRSLKQRQSALLDLQDKLHKRIDSLADQQMKHQGAPFGEKASTTVHAGSHGATPRVHLRELFSKGPEAHANKAVQKAFTRSNARSIATEAGKRAIRPAIKAAIMAAPIERLQDEK